MRIPSENRLGNAIEQARPRVDGVKRREPDITPHALAHLDELMAFAEERILAALIAFEIGQPANRFGEEQHVPAGAPERIGEPVEAGFVVGVQKMVGHEDDAFHPNAMLKRSAQRIRFTQRQMRKSKRARPASTACQSRCTAAIFSTPIDRARSLVSVSSTHGRNDFSQRASGVAKPILSRRSRMMSGTMPRIALRKTFLVVPLLPRMYSSG